jgi:cell division protease FtsH
MAPEVGPVAYGQEEEPIFIGREIAQHKDYSEDTARRIDAAIKTILESALSRVVGLLTEHRDQLERLAGELFAKETLEDADVRILLGFPAREGRA